MNGPGITVSGPKTIGEAIERIVKIARSEPKDWVRHYTGFHGIDDAEAIRDKIQALYTGENHTRERIRTPRETSAIGGDREECAAFAICLAENLGLPYEIRVKGTTLFLYVCEVEILHT